MDKYEESILTAIKEDMRNQSQKALESVHQEVQQLEAEQISHYEESVQKEISDFWESELEELELQATIQASRDQMATKKKLFALRQSLTAELLEDVKEKLRALKVKGDDPTYRQFLQDELRNAKPQDGDQLEADPADFPLLKELLGVSCPLLTFKEGSFPLGGFRLIHPETSVEYDCNLVNRLEQARDWFRSHSGFSVLEEGDHRG